MKKIFLQAAVDIYNCIVEKIYAENFMILSVEVVLVIFVVVFVFALDKGSYKLQLCVVELCCFVLFVKKLCSLADN